MRIASIACVLAAVLAAAAAAVVIAFGYQAHATGQRFASADARFAFASVAQTAWDVNGRFAHPKFDQLLQADDDRDFRQVLRLFRESQPFGTKEWSRLEGKAVRELQRFVKTDRNPPRLSEAWNLIGILAFQNALAALNQGDAKSFVRLFLESKAAFTKAIRLDSGNDGAKYNLELLHMVRLNSNPGPQKKPGAGQREPGRGY